MKINYLHVLTTFLLIGCKEKAAEVSQISSYPVIEVTSGTATTYQEFPASIEGRNNLDIRPQIDGILEQIFVDEGAYVTKGQPLFRIEDLPFKEKMHNASANLKAAKGILENAMIEVARITPLVKSKVVSEYQLSIAQAALHVAQANVEKAEADLRHARITLDYTLIKAPMNGYIGRLSHRKGSLISTIDPISLTEMSDVAQVHVYFALGEYDYILFKQHFPGLTLNEKISKLPPVELILADDSRYIHKGHIDLIDGQFNKHTASITVRATFANEDGLLRSGNTGKIRLGLNYTDQLVIPQASTLDMQDKLYVFLVKKDNTVHKQLISISGTSGKNFMVKEGLTPGDRIVYGGFEQLHEGDKIKPEKVLLANSSDPLVNL